MKKKTLCVVLLWLLALCACLTLADRAMRRDDGQRKYDAFFDDPNGFDVLFYGTSHVFDGVSPMELWRDTGITSYNMANSSEPLDVTEQVLRLSTGIHLPKVALIDIYYIMHSVDEAWTYSFRHLFLDEVPLSLRKFQAVRATLPRSEWIEFLMPFSLYHGRWDELLSGSVERLVDCERFMMGGELRFGLAPEGEYTRTREIDDSPQPGHDAIARIVAYCREKGIQPVLMAIPARVSQEEQRMINGVAPLAQALDVPYLNLFDQEDLVDFATDCYDGIGHLNPNGTRKVTAYLGAWLRAHCELPDHRGDDAYAYWDKNLALYEAFRAQNWE